MYINDRILKTSIVIREVSWIIDYWDNPVHIAVSVIIISRKSWYWLTLVFCSTSRVFTELCEPSWFQWNAGLDVSKGVISHWLAIFSFQKLSPLCAEVGNFRLLIKNPVRWDKSFHTQYNEVLKFQLMVLQFTSDNYSQEHVIVESAKSSL